MIVFVSVLCLSLAVKAFVAVSCRMFVVDRF